MQVEKGKQIWKLMVRVHRRLTLFWAWEFLLWKIQCQPPTCMGIFAQAPILFPVEPSLLRSNRHQVSQKTLLDVFGAMCGHACLHLAHLHVISYLILSIRNKSCGPVGFSHNQEDVTFICFNLLWCRLESDLNQSALCRNSCKERKNDPWQSAFYSLLLYLPDTYT